MSYHTPTAEEVGARIAKKKKQRKYHLPVIGHFADRSVLFDSILHASEVTGIHYSLIFEACIGKIYKAGNIVWEYQKGNHFIKYKAYYINVQDKYTRYSTFNG
jgi:RNA 3'-terminal phosphate cyclase